jgi:sugar O-acyltransferase (sialic acid O-acetyltransferase NeuD family)
MTPLVIIGAGGFGREVHSIIAALVEDGADWVVEGFVDDSPHEAHRRQVTRLGCELVGSVRDLACRTTPFSAVIAVGSAAARSAISSALADALVTYPVLVHPDATVGRGVTFAPGAVVAPGARLSTNIVVGRHVQVDQNVTVGHDSVLQEFSRLNPQACVSGSVQVGAGALVGANATILQGLAVGDDATVGAGAVVTHDVAASSVVKGVPAQ